MQTIDRLIPIAGLLLFSWTAATPAVSAQTAPQTITLTLEEAIQIALVNNYAMRERRLDLDLANAQIRQSWSEVMPSINLESSYTRNIQSANPFAGSEAGGLFGSFGFIDWLAFNERARVDDDGTTHPITFDEFVDRQEEGLDKIGVVFGGGSDNPFAVPNEFQNGITINQTVFSGSAFLAIRAARYLRQFNRRAQDRQEQLVVHQVRRAFYEALLARQQAAVFHLSVARIQETLDETIQRVKQGIAPKFQRLTAEVERANLETQLLNTTNLSSRSIDNLKMQLGIPIDQPIQLRGSLEAEDHGRFMTISTRDAVDLALENRPDLEQARLAIRLRQLDRQATRTQYLPQLSVFANLSYFGRVPDDRTRILSEGEDTFEYRQESIGFFSQSYWNPSVSAGLRLTWSIFNGFQTRALVQQRQIAVSRSEIQYEQAYQQVWVEVQNALRSLGTARQRILAQEKNVQRAELNYEYVRARLAEGVASPLEERNASEQLDQTRLNHLQAVHDYLVAESAFETSVGVPGPGTATPNLTSNQSTHRP